MDPFVPFLQDVAANIGEEHFVAMVGNTDALRKPRFSVRDRQDILEMKHGRNYELLNQLRSKGHLSRFNCETLVALLKEAKEQDLAKVVKRRFEIGFEKYYDFEKLQDEVDAPTPTTSEMQTSSQSTHQVASNNEPDSGHRVSPVTERPEDKEIGNAPIAEKPQPVSEITHTPVAAKPQPVEQEANKRSVLILNDEWGTSKGGISSFHRQIAQLSLKAGCEVYVTALKADDKDRKHAKENGIHLIVANNKNDKPTNLEWLTDTQYCRIFFPGLKDIPNLERIIAHAPITAEAAINIRDDLFEGKQKVTLFIHVIPEDIEIHKKTHELGKVQRRENDIQELAKKADEVFSVGPRIYKHFQNKFRGLSIKHHLFLPLPDPAFFDVVIQKPDVNQMPKMEVLTVGRVTGVEELKGYDIVAKALSGVADEMKDRPPVWKIRGISEEQKDESEKFIRRNLQGKHLQPNLYPYGDLQDILNDLRVSCLFLMPSRSEPFGLVGLEALAAGIPVLITKNSGLAEFLSAYFPPQFAEWLVVDVGVTDHEDDVEIWKVRILKILRDCSRWFDVAAEIKEKLKDHKDIKKNQEEFIEVLKA
ncbi:uncharacterized protein LOC144452653 [Glandiceps talaboti]